MGKDGKTSDDSARGGGKSSGPDLTAYGMLRGGDLSNQIVNAVAAHGADDAAKARSEYNRRWSEKVAETHGFWRKIKVIIVG